jgi:hypothetical protein
MALQSLCNHFAIALQSLRSRFAIALLSLCNRFAIALRSLCNWTIKYVKEASGRHVSVSGFGFDS